MDKDIRNAYLELLRDGRRLVMKSNRQAIMHKQYGKMFLAPDKLSCDAFYIKYGVFNEWNK